MSDCVAQYFRYPRGYVNLVEDIPVLTSSECPCPGAQDSDHHTGVKPTLTKSQETLGEALSDSLSKDGRLSLPFDLSQVIDILRYEQYAEASTDKSKVGAAINWAYYSVRPLLSVSIRKHLQSLHLRQWQQRSFPHWPVDRTVDHLLERSLSQSLRAAGIDRVPFIWFWPDGAPACAIMTHDVETRAGRDFCGTLMDLDESFGIGASFQVVPEDRYEVPKEYLASIIDRGFEVGVQDLNHDGKLYRSRHRFIERAAKINAYGRQWGAQGFRSAVLYRRQEWFEALDFAYEMSVPNVAHLDPQRGGCCTVMPYFVGKILELPVTMTQDYSLFHILKDYSISLWMRQIELVVEAHGLISFIVHPDYITETREREVFRKLLAYLARLRSTEGIWITPPDQVNQWWRARAEMELVEDNQGLRIEGRGSERARIAYAKPSGDRLQYSFQDGSVISKTLQSQSIER